MPKFVPLQSLIEAVTGAVNEAQRLVEQQQVESLRTFLDGDRPRTLTLRLPTLRNDAQHDEMDDYAVPLMALVPHSAVAIKQVEVRFDLELGELADADRADRTSTETARQRSTLTVDPATSVDPAKRGPLAHVTLIVEALERPEALSRLIDELVRTQGYRPKPKDEPRAPGSDPVRPDPAPPRPPRPETPPSTPAPKRTKSS